MGWTVYCAVLPSGWYINTGNYHNAPNGLLEVSYKHGSQELQLLEGNLCGLITGFCGGSGWKSVVADGGPAAFDHLTAELYLGAAAKAVDVGYGTTHEYMAYGTGLTSSQLLGYAAAIRAVPR